MGFWIKWNADKKKRKIKEESTESYEKALHSFVVHITVCYFVNLGRCHYIGIARCVFGQTAHLWKGLLQTFGQLITYRAMTMEGTLCLII